MGQTVMLSRSTPTALVSVPSGGLVDGEWRIESGYNRLFDMAEFDEFFVAGAYRYHPVTAAFGLSKFGKSDFYSELRGKFSLAGHYRQFAAGLNVSGLLVQFGRGYGDVSQVTMGAGLSVRTKRFFASITGDNLTSPKLYDNAVAYDSYYSLYTEVIGKQSFSINGLIRLEGGEKPQFGLGQKIFIARQAAIFWGISTNPTQYGSGLELQYEGGSISYAFSNHPVLGISHTIAVSYGGGGPRARGDNDFK